MQKIGSGVISMIFVILIAAILPASLWYASPWRSWRIESRVTQPTSKKVVRPFTLNVNKVPGQYFGKLAGQQTAASPQLDRATSSVAPAPGRALGMGGGNAVSEKMMASSIMPVDFKNYKFEFKGDLSLGTSSVEVLRRIKTIDNGIDTNSLLSSLNFGPADLSSFNGMLMQSASFIQKGEYGYVLNISFDDGSVSFGQNWETWPAGRCGGDQACYEGLRIKSLDEVPADSEIIAIADAFVKEHGINVSMFGNPEIRDYGIRGMDAAARLQYLPEAIDVIYPLKINDQNVYDEYGGQKQGLTVSVQIKDKRVSSVYGLTTQSYESSLYDVETDAKKILSYAETGGVNSYAPEGAKSVTLELGEPIHGYIKYFNSGNLMSGKGMNDELLVPALVFPIQNPPKDDPSFFRTYVIVPLAKEVLDERLKGLSGNPVPYMMKGGVGVSAPAAAEIKK